MSNKIVFFGNERLATGVSTELPLLSGLFKAGYDIEAIITTAGTSGPSRKERPLEVEIFAKSHNIRLIKINKIADAASFIASHQSPIAILAAFGKIIPQSVIDSFPKGIVNLHPSLLPMHRGPIPIEAPILAGEQITGVSIMKLSAAMDAGPVYDQQKLTLSGNETKPQLAAKLNQLGAERLIKVLPSIIDGSLLPKEQDEAAASYDTKLSPTNAQLDFNKPALVLERQVRAFLGWPRSKTTLNSQPVIITAAHVENDQTKPGEIYESKDSLKLGTKQNWLVIDRLIPAGRNELSIADYLRGRQNH